MTITIERRSDRERQDGNAPLHLRITHQGRQRYLALGIYAKASEWDAGRARLRGRSKQVADMNAVLGRAEQAAADAVAELHRRGKPLSAEAVRDAVAELLASASGAAEASDFCAYARAFNEGYRRKGQHRTWRRVNAILNKLEPFLRERAGEPRRVPVSERRVPFEAVTPRLMREWVELLMAPEEEGGHGNLESTAATNLSAVRTICRAAIREEVAPAAWRDPTQAVRLRERPAPKERLERDEIARLAALSEREGVRDGTTYTPGRWRTDGELMGLVRDMFLFSLYLAGIRFGDTAELRFEHVRRIHGRLRLVYRMGKTSEEASIPLSEPARLIFERYHAARRDLPLERTGGRIFGILDGRTRADGSWASAEARSKALGSANALANKQLRRLAELAEIKRADVPMALTFHIARHSWADLARRSDWHLTDIQQALGHSSPQITQRYLESFDRDRLDEKFDTLF